MILRDRCSTSYDLASIFRGMRSTLDRWSGKIAQRIGTRPSALHSTFHFWRKSRRIVPSFILSISKIDEVSQNCFVIDVVKFEKWRSLAELFRFWRCQVQKLRKSRRTASFWCCQLCKMKKSRRIAAFLTLSSSNIENVSQNCCVFDVVNKKMRQCRRLAAFLILSSSKPEDVLQNSFVFKLADRQVDRQTERLR